MQLSRRLGRDVYLYVDVRGIRPRRVRVFMTFIKANDLVDMCHRRINNGTFAE